MAKGLARFEDFAERLVEGTFDRLRRGRPEPVDIARRLSRAMEDNQTISAGKIFVPNVYRVGLHPETFQGFVSFKEPLEEELAAYLADEAERQGFDFIGWPHVILTADTGVSHDRFTTHAELAGGGSAPADDIDMTQVMRTNEIQGPEAADQLPHAEALQLVIGPRSIPLTQGPISIGRRLDNDVIIQATSVSRRHAQIVFRHGRWLLRDLHSTYGTQVNDHVIEECVLRAGDTIRFGDVTVDVRKGAAVDLEEKPEGHS